MTIRAIGQKIAWAGKLVATDAASIRTIWKLSPKPKTVGAATIDRKHGSPADMLSSEQKPIVLKDTNTLQKTPPDVQTDHVDASNVTATVQMPGIGG